MNDKFNLTQYTNAGGCAAKLDPGKLSRLLSGFKLVNENVLVGFDGADDAGVYKLTDELAMVQTTDFFTPIVNDPYDFGAVAATNALSDIFAMGAEVTSVLNLASIPKDLDDEAIRLLFQGAYDKVKEAGAVILGGHTISENILIYGLAVSGVIHPGKIMQNNMGKPDQALVLTKPLGCGVYATAYKCQMLEDEDYLEWVDSMKLLNKDAAAIAKKYDVSTMTDITGFGLLGHGTEIAKASNIQLVFDYAKVPLFSRMEEYASKDAISGGSYRNGKYVGETTFYSEQINQIKKDILNDPQTSGGLLILVDHKDSEKMVDELKSKGMKAGIVGYTKEYVGDFVSVIESNFHE